MMHLWELDDLDERIELWRQRTGFMASRFDLWEWRVAELFLQALESARERRRREDGLPFEEGLADLAGAQEHIACEAARCRDGAELVAEVRGFPAARGRGGR